METYYSHYLPNPNFNPNQTLNQVFTLKLIDLHYGDVFVPIRKVGPHNVTM